MKLSWLIATRFFFRSKKDRSLALFTVISVLSITFSVMLFLFIDTIINGLTHNLEKTLLGFEAPLSVEMSPQDVEMALDKINSFEKKNPKYKFDKVTIKQFDGLVEAPGQVASGVRVRSVDKEFLKIKKNDFEIYWFEDFNEEKFIESDNQILMGEGIYETFSFLPGDEEMVMVTHPYADFGPSGEMEPVQKVFHVAGIFSTGRMDFDQVYLLTSDLAITSLASDALLEHQIFLYPKKDSDIHDIKNQWQLYSSDPRVSLKTWFDKNKSVLKAMSLEKMMYFVIFVFVVLISCFNLAGVISIFGMSKSDEGAILKSLGLTKRNLRQIFMNIGFILGSVGSFFGLAIGVSLILLAKHSHLSLPEAYGFTELPLAINSITLFALLVCTPVLSSLVAYYPAHRMSQKTITEVLRLS